jgi:tRNA threonylcarbamoyladenosine biosynthesis protein TsaB
MAAKPQGSFPGSPAGGLVLAMDTAGQEGSAALARAVAFGGGESVSEPGGLVFPSSLSMEILASRILRPEDEHASLLVPRILELLEEASAAREQLSGIVVGAGPGSFTGVRVGAATAKGMAWALGIPLWAFSSLAAAAADLDGGEARFRCVLFDARGDRLYAAAYGFGNGFPETVFDPRATSVDEILDGMIPPGAVLLGDGARRHQDRFQEAGHVVLPYPAGRPTALGLIRLLALDPGRPPLGDPGRWEPCYLRESGAERMWKTRRKWKA